MTTRSLLYLGDFAMAEYFEYANLTWPEVAALPRDVPLVLPLGPGYDLKELAGQLSNPLRVGLLPPFPFGWRGSGLELPAGELANYLNNLILSLRDDGFTRVYALTPQETARLASPEFQLTHFTTSPPQPSSPLPPH